MTTEEGNAVHATEISGTENDRIQLAMLSPSSIKPFEQSLAGYSSTVDPFLFTLLGFDEITRDSDDSLNILPSLIDINRETMDLIKRKLVHFNHGEGASDSILLRETAEAIAEREGVVAVDESMRLLDVLQLPVDTTHESARIFSGLEEVDDITISPVRDEEPVDGSTIRGKTVYRKDNEGEGEAEGEGEGEGEDFSGLDLESDFIVCATALLPGFESGQETALDMNGFELDATGEVAQIENGIPDLAEILLIQGLLQSSCQDAVDRWIFLENFFGSPASGYESLYNIGIAYCCIGDFGSAWLGTTILSIAINEAFDYEKLFTVMATTDFQFSASGDIDGDEYNALIEWTQYGTGTTFADKYINYVYAVLDPSTYPSSITLRTITRTASEANILQIYPLTEKVADGAEVKMYPLFGFDLNDFNNITPLFDHWYITGETALSPRYCTREPLELTVESNINVELSLIVWNPSTVVSFPDSNLESAVRSELGIYSGNLTIGDVCQPNFDMLYAPDNSIADLTGLEYCRYLKSLSLRGNALDETDLQKIATNYRLLELYLECNSIEELDYLANLHDLEMLALGPSFLSQATNNNALDAYDDLTPIAHLPHLMALNLTDTDLHEDALLPLAGKESLWAIICCKNTGVDLTPIASMPNLNILWDSYSGLTDTDLSVLNGMTPLNYILFIGNHITDLSVFDSCTEMEEVYVQENANLQDVPNYFPSIKTLYLMECDIDDITPLLDIDPYVEDATINLTDNPLEQAQSCAVVQTLRGMGVTVIENTLDCEYTLTYNAGANGSIQGLTPQPVSDGGSGLPVTAVGDSGYHFLEWSDSRTDNPRTDTNVTGNITVTALFAYTYTLTVLPSNDGQGFNYGEVYLEEDVSCNGPLPCTEFWLYPCPTPGYRFSHWEDETYQSLGSDTPYYIVLNNPDTAIHAVFVPQPEVTITIDGDGLVDAYAEQTLCDDVDFDLESGPGAFRTQTLLPYTYVSADKSLYEPDSQEMDDLLDTVGWRFDYWQTSDPQNPEHIGTDIPLVLTPEVDESLTAVFREHHLPTDLQLFINFLRDSEVTIDPVDTLQLLITKDGQGNPIGADALKALIAGSGLENDEKAYMEDMLLDTFYDDTPLAIDIIGMFNLNTEHKGFSVPDMIEFSVLEIVLENPSHPLHTTVAHAYQNNLAIWLEYNNALAQALPGFVYPPSGVVHALAAYSTIHPCPNDPEDEISGIAATLYWLHLHRLYDEPPLPPMSVFNAEFMAVPELFETGDADGDGFSNIDEWWFTYYSTEGGSDLITDWSNPSWFDFWILGHLVNSVASETSIPYYDEQWPSEDFPPRVQLSLAVEGSGSIVPFTGEMLIPKYSLTDWQAWVDDGEPGDAADHCALQNVLLTALPANEWVFLYWHKEKGSIKQILEASQTSYGVSLNIEDAAITVPLTQDTALIAEMEHRPELAGLDLVAHLGEFLVAIGELSNEDDVWLFEWDCTGLEIEEGNGIPDAAEFALLQSVLEDTALNLFRSGGVINSFVYEDWVQNIAQAAVDLPTQTLGIQRAVAAYMTLGYYGATRALRALTLEHFSVALDIDDYANGSARWFDENNDCDNDGLSNLGEWQEVFDENSSSYAANSAAAAALSKNAKDPAEPNNEPTSTACSDYVNHDCLPIREIQLNDAYEHVVKVLSITASSDDCQATISDTSYGKVMTVREGYEVRVTVNCVACDFAVFDRWSAPGHLFDGSDQKQESFIVSGNASISLVPKSVLPTTICIPPSRFNENFTLSVEGRGTSVDPYYAGEVFMGHEVTSPPNEPVLVSYEYTGPQLPPLILSPGGYKSQDSSGHTCNYATEVWLAKKEVLNELYPRLDIMEHDTVTHIATSDVGWPVIRNGALFTDYHDDFLGQVTLDQQPVHPVTGCRPSPGIMSWLFDFVDLPTGFSWYNATSQIDCAGKVTVEHEFKRMLTLTLESQGEQGYAVASPARKYYAEPFTGLPGYEQVTITARPLPGFEFKEWDGDGYCYVGSVSPENCFVLRGCSSPTVTILMEKNKTVVPNFRTAPFAQLTLCTKIGDFACVAFTPFPEYGHAWIELTYNNLCGNCMEDAYCSSFGYFANGFPLHSQGYVAAPDTYAEGAFTNARFYNINIYQCNSMREFIRQHFPWNDSTYNALFYNCASFAAKCVQIATGEYLHYRGSLPGAPFGIPLPSALCLSIDVIETIDPTSVTDPKDVY